MQSLFTTSGDTTCCIVSDKERRSHIFANVLGSLHSLATYVVYDPVHLADFESLPYDYISIDDLLAVVESRRRSRKVPQLNEARPKTVYAFPHITGKIVQSEVLMQLIYNGRHFDEIVVLGCKHLKELSDGGLRVNTCMFLMDRLPSYKLLECEGLRKEELSRELADAKSKGKLLALKRFPVTMFVTV
jgi:hypothetical protein